MQYSVTTRNPGVVQPWFRLGPPQTPGNFPRVTYTGCDDCKQPSALQGLRGLSGPGIWGTPQQRTFWWVLSTVTAIATFAHGYERNKSLGWGAAWAAFGFLMPPLAAGWMIGQRSK